MQTSGSNVVKNHMIWPQSPHFSGITHARKTLISPTKEKVGKNGKAQKLPSISRQCELLGIARSTSYYKCKEGESQENLRMMELMDKQYDRCSAMGVRQMVDYLKGEGYHVGRIMGLKAVYPLNSLSKGGWITYRMPYLLRG